MPTTPLTIWCNAQFPEEVTAQLIAGTSNHRLIFDDQRGSNLTAGGPNASLAEASVAFGQPDPSQVIALPQLDWVHLTSAGYTRYDRDDLRQALRDRNAQLTNSSSVFDEPCAQHLVAFMLAQARQLPQSYADQLGPKSWTYDNLRGATRLLSNETVLILGFGAIARRLVELLKPFRLKLVAVRQTVKGDEPIPTFPVTELESLLGTAHHVVNILPASPRTDNLVDEKVQAAMKPGAIFYNIGRGTTVDQSALVRNLESGHIGAAYLDVTDPEPLPANHPLWAAPNCLITPHIGGGFAEEAETIVAHFLANLRRYEAGDPLEDKVV